MFLLVGIILHMSNTPISQIRRFQSRQQLPTELDFNDMPPIGIFNRTIDNFNETKCASTNAKIKYVVQKRIDRIDLYEHLITSNASDLDSIKTNFTCVICDNLLYPPTTLSCGHSFCKLCIDELGKSTTDFDLFENQIKCPECRKVCDKTCVSVNILIKKLMDNYTIKCPNNCGCVTKMENIFDHYSNCKTTNTKNVNCFWCKETVNMLLVDDHIINKCEYRKEQCQRCNKFGPHKYLSQHEITCKPIMTTCNMCKKSIKKTDISNHINNTCEKRSHKCAYCNKKMDGLNKKYIDDHQEKCIFKPIKCEYCKKSFKKSDFFLHKCK